MSSHPQDKPLMSRSLKLVKRWENYQALNLLLLERNQAKDHEDIPSKKPNSE